MKITGLSAQQTNSNRINVFVDDKYRFSLEISQIASLRVRVGGEYSESELEQLEQESQFGKLYARALEYCLMRPHSAKGCGIICGEKLKQLGIDLGERAR